MSNEITAEDFAENFLAKGSFFETVGIGFKHGSAFGLKDMAE